MYLTFVPGQEVPQLQENNHPESRIGWFTKRTKESAGKRKKEVEPWFDKLTINLKLENRLLIRRTVFLF